MEEFIDNVKVLINALGYKVLEPFVQKGPVAVQADDEVLYVSSSVANASGKVTAEGFVVLEGAVINQKNSVKSLSPGIQKLRQRLIDSEKVQEWVTQEDILFSSSSAAAGFILGHNVSGPQTWRTKAGRTLKDIENGEMG